MACIFRTVRLLVWSFCFIHNDFQVFTTGLCATTVHSLFFPTIEFARILYSHIHWIQAIYYKIYNLLLSLKLSEGAYTRCQNPKSKIAICWLHVSSFQWTKATENKGESWLIIANIVRNQCQARISIRYFNNKSIRDTVTRCYFNFVNGKSFFLWRKTKRSENKLEKVKKIDKRK